MSTLDKYEFPCNNKCPVFACCNIYCLNVFNYINLIAQQIYKMNDEQKDMYRKTTPDKIKRKVQQLYMKGGDLTFPLNIQMKRSMWK